MNSESHSAQSLFLSGYSSIAGLWSARVAADHFEEVIIVEPETWLADSGKGNLYNAEGIPIFEGEAPSRARVAQYPFVHSELIDYSRLLNEPSNLITRTSRLSNYESSCTEEIFSEFT